LFSSRAPIGYVAVAANEIATNQGFKSFVLPRDIDPSYAFYYLKSIRRLADSLGTGTTFREISGATAKTLPFRLAPTAEQTRIAVKLDELLAKVDTLKARIDGIPALLKRFRQSALAAAVSGRLTKEWRVAVDEASQDQGFLYPVRPLGVIARFIDYRGKTPEKVAFGIPLITAKNIKPGYISRTPREFIHPEEYEGWMTRGIPKVGDVLITTEAPLGNVAVVDIKEKFALAQRAICLQFHEGYSSSFAAIALQSPVLQQELARRSTGTTVKGIKASVLKKVDLPAPSIGEQIEIVRRVEQLFAYADLLEKKVNEARKRIDHLTQSILAKAFRGKLVPQDPNDEPADALLERIKAQRAAAPKVKRGRRPTALS
jgi:type I restriction enzyme S subunit